MLMAGGEGGGKLLSTALALARARLPIELVVVCGRNEPLEQKLGELSAALPTPMHVLGFTDKIPEYFRAVDLLVTKAGPGTLAEANAAQLPVVVYDFVPGQERGNVDFVRHNGLGVIALQGATKVVAAVRGLISNPERLAIIRHNQEIVAPRRSSRRIAALIKSITETRDDSGIRRFCRPLTANRSSCIDQGAYASFKLMSDRYPRNRRERARSWADAPNRFR